MNNIYVKARAKINLTLNVLDKRKDGYHELKSIMQKINLYDELFITKNNLDDINIKMNTLEIEKEKNILYKTYILIKGLYNIGGVDVKVNKKIPMQAGLRWWKCRCSRFYISIK